MDEINYLSGPGRGVILIKLVAPDDRVLGFTASTGDRDLLTLETTRGGEQTISTAKYEITGRGGRGRELLQRGGFVRVIWPDPDPPPSFHWRRITPTTWPGARAPAVRLADNSQLFDRLGPGFTLVDLSGEGVGEPMVKEAKRGGIPMTQLALDDGAARACWERDLVLVRPDQHVAWRGDDVPGEWEAVLDRVTGRETP